MALRSRSRTATATSGPGRGPASDGRARRRSTHRARHRSPAPADDLRRRAAHLFGERAERGREPGGVSGSVPVPAPVSVPVPPPVPAAGPATTAVTGAAPGLSAARVAEATGGGVDEDPAPESGADGGARSAAAGGVPRAGPAGPFSPARRERAGAAVRERMPVWLQARCGVERRPVVALAVLLAALAAFAVQHFWAGRTESVSAPRVVRAGTPSAGSPASAGRGEAVRAGGSGAPGDGSAAAGAQIVVDVGGKVREPGIRRLPAGSRVADALRAAGGIRPGASTEGLNRARFLVDGEQVVVGAPAGAPAPPGPAPGAGTGAGQAGAGPAAPVSLNTATADQLDALPGVGPVLAQHIIDYRTRRGGFRSVGELRQVNGIGDRRFADLRPLVRP